MTASKVFVPIAGVPLQLTQDLAVVLAPNPSAMTGTGTNTFVLGREAVAVIDPGPDDDAHLAALVDLIAGRHVTHIFVTHSHLDHSALAPKLSRATGASVYAFGDSLAGRSATMQTLAAAGSLGSGEGVDEDFSPDHRLADNSEITGPWGCIRALHTPGHMSNHMSFAWNGALFCGDHVMAWSSSLISPPDGDLTAFMASCQTLMQYGDHVFYPAHGAPIDAPKDRLAWLVAHRKSREREILSALAKGPASSAALVRQIYTGLSPDLFGAAQSSVMAHLLDLHDRNEVTASDPVSRQSIFEITT